MTIDRFPEAQPTTAASCRARLAQLCASLGEGSCLTDAREDGDGCAATLRTAEGGAIELRLDERSLHARAAGWPEVRHHGMQRRFGRDISARLGAHREPAQIASELRRRVLDPYAAALRDERHRAQQFRSSLHRLSTELRQAGIRERDLHVVGRKLVAQRPYAPLDSCGAALPSDSTTTIALHDTVPVANIEVRNLSPSEAGELHRFVDELMARRRKQLRLCA